MNLDLQVGVLPAALAAFEDNTFHAALFDPPYGLSEDPPPELITTWLDGGHRPRRGFLGRLWDGMPPGPPFWRELLRVLRPGATAIAFGGDRTFGLQDIAMRFGGFEILPAFAWLHAEAQAHGGNVGKLADKAAGAEREVLGPNPNRGVRRSSTPCWSTEGGHLPLTAPATPLAKLFDGHDSRLRGNYEPICVGRKPLDGTLAENAARWGVAGFDVQGGRVPTAAGDYDHPGRTVEAFGAYPIAEDNGDRGQSPPSARGRFPSTVLLSHSVDCHPERCVPECPAAVLKEQGGDRGKSDGIVGVGRGLTEGDRTGRTDAGQKIGYGDSGTADRFYFQARPARRERSAGCEGLFWRRAPEHPDGWEIVDERGSTGGSLTRSGMALDPQAHEFEGNPHPTIKSLELTRYLAKLLLQPGPDAKILVPFSGSGSESIGAMLAGWPHVVAIEQSPQWVEVSRRRAAFWQPLAELGARDAAIGELLGEFHEKLVVVEDVRQGSLWG